MRIAVISDIHSNLEALQKALEIISKSSIDEIICLGDTVGYGANPNECLDLVRSKTPYILLGNHDEAALDPSIARSFNRHARTAAEWTAEELTDANKEFLKSLPCEMMRHEIYFVHSSPFEPSEWHYIITPADAQKNFPKFSNRICFVGHSHEPFVYGEDGTTDVVVPGKRYIINVGSIGQPRDNDPRLSFGIIDTGADTYENIRADYDVKTASDKIRRAGLPALLAERILVGR